MQSLMVRHGKAKSNVDIENGKVGSDAPLIRDGIEQVRETAKFLGPMVIATEIITSPLRRARETSEILAEVLKLEVVIDDRLSGINKGDWHGRPVPEVIEMEGEIPDDQKPFFRPPNGQNWLDVGAQMTALMMDRVRSGDPQCLLVSHNHPIQMAIGALLGKPVAQWQEVSVDNASVTGLRYANGLWRLEEGLVNVRPYEPAA